MNDDFRAEDKRNPSLAGARADARPVPVPTPVNETFSVDGGSQAREQLISELAARGIDDAHPLTERMDDSEVDRALKVVEHYDAARARRPQLHKGFLMTLLRDEQFQPSSPPETKASTPESRSRKQYDEFCEWARRERFSERMVPFAASAYATLKFMRSAEPTRAEVKARVLKQYPWLEKA